MSDLRSYLDAVEGDLYRVAAEVSPRFEISAVLEQAERSGRAVLFERIEGYPGVRIAGNLVCSRRLAARALGTDPQHLTETYVERTAQSVAPIGVEDAPVQEVVLEAPEDVSAVLPIPTYHEKDAAPFLSCGVVIARSPATGQRGMGIHRMMFKGGRRFGIYLANPPLSRFLDEAEERGEPLPVAVALGVDPAILIAAVVKSGPRGPDKMEIAGALREAPVELTGGVSIDLEVPARAEVVLEGHLVPGLRETEGPFGENTGFYFSDVSPVFETSAVTHRHEPIVSALKPWGGDVDTLLSLAAGAELLGQLRGLIPGVVDLELAPGTCGFAAVIAVRRMPKTEVRRLIHLALVLDRRLKLVTVVNDQVDPRDPRQVAWAMATLFRPDRDLVAIEGMASYVIDPAADAGGRGTKLGFDASGDPDDTRDRVAVPPSAAARAREILDGLD